MGGTRCTAFFGASSCFTPRLKEHQLHALSSKRTAAIFWFLIHPSMKALLQCRHCSCVKAQTAMVEGRWVTAGKAYRTVNVLGVFIMLFLPGIAFPLLVRNVKSRLIQRSSLDLATRARKSQATAGKRRTAVERNGVSRSPSRTRRSPGRRRSSKKSVDVN